MVDTADQRAETEAWRRGADELEARIRAWRRESAIHPLHNPRAEAMHRRAQRAEADLEKANAVCDGHFWELQARTDQLVRMRAKRDKWRRRYNDLPEVEVGFNWIMPVCISLVVGVLWLIGSIK